MQQLEKVITEFFPTEKILNTYSVSLKKETKKAFNILFSYFQDPKIKLYKGIRLAETENYWFVDTRYKVRLTNRILTLLSILLVFFFFGNQFLQTDIWFLIILFVLFIASLILYMYFLQQGFLIKVYEKKWVKVKKEGNRLSLGVTLPKYSKDSVWKLKFGNKLLDLVGLTISSAEMKVDDVYEIED